MKKTAFLFYLIAFFGIFNQTFAQRGYHNAPYTRYEADLGIGNGQVKTSTAQNHIAFEASERTCVYLSNGQYRELTAQTAFRGIVVRAAGASSETGHNGQNVSARVYINNVLATTLTFYANRGWVNVVTDGNPNYNGKTNSNPRMRYDEQRYLHSASVSAGAVIKIESQGNLYLDFIEIEDATEIAQPNGYAVYNGDKNDKNALQNFINSNQNIYLPAGTYNISGTLELSGTKNVQGAGMWFTQINFTNGSGSGGFYGHSRNASLKHVSLTRTTGYSRTSSYKGLNGVWGNISYVWAERFECGAWFGNYNGGYGDPYADGMVIEHCRFRNNYADGINFCLGTRNSVARYCNFRNNGDDDMAVWAAGDFSRGTCRNNTFEYNTAEHCWLASSCALYGGYNNKWQHIIVKDNYEVGIRVNNIFSGYKFDQDGASGGAENSMYNIELIRCGTTADAWNNALGAIDLDSHNGSGQVRNIRFSCIEVKDPIRTPVFSRIGNNFGDNMNYCGITANGVLVSALNNNTNCSCSFAEIINISINNCPSSQLNTGGATVQLSAAVTGTANTAVTWSSSNNNIASVNSSGLVTTGSQSGSVTITATSQADNTKSATCTFNVAAQAVIQVAINNCPSSQLNIGGATVQLSAAVTGTANTAVTWSSSNNNIASVNSSGLVTTGSQSGSVTITATSQADNTKTATCTFNVATSATPFDLIVDDFYCTPQFPQAGQQVVFTAIIKNIGGTATPNNVKHGIAFTINNNDGSYANATTWNDQHFTSIAAGQSVTLTTTGGMGAAHSGNAWLPATNGTYQVEAFVNDGTDNEMGEVNRANNKLIKNIEVGAAVPTITGVTISNCPSANLETGNQITLSASGQGTGGTIPQTVTWQSSNPSVASVNNGVVAALAAGQTTITATSTADNSKSTVCNITVVAATVNVTGITISPKIQTINIGGQITFSAIITPSNATNQSVNYSVISGNGTLNNNNNNVLTANGAGVIIVRASSASNPSIYDEATITVNQPLTITDVTISGCPSANLEIGNEITLSASVQGTGGTIPQTVTWQSSNPSVASVNNGVVAALAAGQTTISATSTADNSKNATCIINVNVPLGVGNIEEDGKTIISYNNTVEIQGVEIGEKISVYNVLGIKLISQTATHNPLIINNLQAGIYIIFIENKNISAKVVVR